MAGTINLYSIGLNYASATSSSAIFNIVPVVAFILAVMFRSDNQITTHNWFVWISELIILALRHRMETLNLRTSHGMAKASGILLCVGGVIVLALYQGPALKSPNHHQLLSHHASAAAAHAHSGKNWALGIFLMTTSVVIWSLWTVQQVVTLLPLLFMNFVCLFFSAAGRG